MLLKKALRAIWSNKRSYLSCIFLMMIGVLMYVAMNTAGDGLNNSVESFYEDSRLADVFAVVKSMPISYADAFLEIEGIKEAYPRSVEDVRVDIPESDDAVTLRLITTNTGDEPGLNELLITGTPLVNDNDIILNTTFFNAHGINFGDSVDIILNGRSRKFNVCATALSPEYAYITKSALDVLPDEKGFGIGWITPGGMALLDGLPGTANSVVFALEEGYSFDDVKIELEDALSPFGLQELQDKSDLLSYSFLELEVDGIRSVATSMPMLFILMAAVVLYLMMKRVIEQERTQIGTLKAFGHSNLKILAHYLSYGAITGAVGSLLGCIYGYFMSEIYFNLFLQFFMLPGISEGIRPVYIMNAMLMGIGGGLVGALMGAYKAVKLNPAEAMRPESPKQIKRDILGSFLKEILPPRASMAMRSVVRNPARSIFIVIGVMFSFGLLCISGSFNSLIDKMIYGQFTDIQLYGVKLILNQPVQYEKAVESASLLEHVTLAEGLLEIPVELKSKHLKEGAVLTGIDQYSELFKVCDTNSKEIFPPPTDSIIITNGIAKELNAKAGDSIYISSPLLDEDVLMRISRVIEQNLGTGCYMEIGTLSDLFNQPKSATAVILNTSDFSALKEYLKNADNIRSIDDKDSTLNKYRDMMEMYSSIYLVLEIMSALVAFAIIYNISNISLSERKREYATLRVVGLSVKEVSRIMNIEYWVLGVIGMIFGIPFTFLLNYGMNTMMDTTMFTMPSSLPASAFTVGFIGCAAVILLSGYLSKRRIARFDMVEVLKERE